MVWGNRIGRDVVVQEASDVGVAKCGQVIAEKDFTHNPFVRIRRDVQHLDDE